MSRQHGGPRVTRVESHTVHRKRVGNVPKWSPKPEGAEAAINLKSSGHMLMLLSVARVTLRGLSQPRHSIIQIIGVLQANLK